MADWCGPIKVTIANAENGDVLEERVVANDYCLITVGNRYVKSIQIMGRTHMIAVAVVKPGPANVNECPACKRMFRDGETCGRGGCPMGGDF